MAFQTHTAGSSDLAASVTWANNAEVLVTTGDQIIDTNVDQSAFSALALVIARSFKGLMGKATAPILVDIEGSPANADAYLHYLAEAGSMHYGGVGRVVRNLVVDSPRGRFVGLGGTFTNIAHAQGDLELGAACAVTTLRQWGGRSQLDHNAASVDVTLLGAQNGMTEMTTRRDGTYTLGRNTKLTVDHKNSSPSITINQNDSLASVRVLNGDIDEVNYLEPGDFNCLDSESLVTIAQVNHGPRGLAGFRVDARHTITATKALAGSDVGAPITGSI